MLFVRPLSDKVTQPFITDLRGPFSLKEARRCELNQEVTNVKWVKNTSIPWTVELVPAYSWLLLPRLKVIAVTISSIV